MKPSIPAKTTIHPVIRPVPLEEQQLKGRDKVACLRAQARKALALSARYSQVTLGPLVKAKNGAPQPSNGIYWSLTHKNAYVAAVTSLAPVGIDIEEIAPVSEGVANRIAEPDEWDLAHCRDLILFFRYWTAKEAVLKAIGIGLAGLDRCRVETILDELHLRLSYEGRLWTVAHHWSVPDHLVTVTSDGVDIEWHVEPGELVD